MLTTESIALIIGAYLLGALPSAYLLVLYLRRTDIRRYGSGNVGISNVAIHIGKKRTVPLVIFDILIKGSLPVVLGSDRVLDLGLGVQAAAGLATIVGHNWSIFLRFHGGRGMATVLGVLVTLNWPLVVLYGVVAGIGWFWTKNSALWWGIAALLLPAWSLLLRLPLEITWLCAGFVTVVAAKRLISNRPLRDQPPKSVPRTRLYWYRLLYDRDISNREEWVYRTPEA